MNLQSLPSIVLLITLQIAGLIAIWGLFDQKLKARTKEKDELEERVTKLYRDESDALGKKINGQAEEIKAMQTDMARMSGENKLMRDLLTGQDKDTRSWRDRTEQSMKIVEKMSELVMENGKKADATLKGIEKVGQHVERLAVAIEKTTQ